MEYRTLGRTGLKVSEIGLGGEWLERLDAQGVKAIIDRCEELGVNIIDIWMSEPNVRSNIGDAIRGKRDKWIIQGHIGSTWQDGQYKRDRSLEQTRIAFEDLLTRLGTDYIDLGMIHYVDELSDWEEIQTSEFLQYIRQQQEAGRIRFIGMGTHNPEVARVAAESGVLDMMLFSVNPAFDMLPVEGDPNRYFGDDFSRAVDGISPERTALYQLCEQLGVGITVMKGYAGGRLFDAQRSPFGVALTPVQCLHYCLTRPAVSSVMVGCAAPEHVDAAAAYYSATQDERDYASVLAGAPRHAYSGQCTYCGHCKPCPMNIDIAMVNKLCDLAVMQQEVPSSVQDHYRQLAVKASACVGCRSCESRCPFGVKIAERMEKTAALLG